MKKTNLL